MSKKKMHMQTIPELVRRLEVDILEYAVEGVRNPGGVGNDGNQPEIKNRGDDETEEDGDLLPFSRVVFFDIPRHVPLKCDHEVTRQK